MYVAPLNYDRFFKKVFSDESIAKTFLQDFLDVKIEEITRLKEKHRITDEAAIVEFDYRCKIDDSYVIIDMQQWYKRDIVSRFYVDHSLSTVLQLEDMPTKTILLNPKSTLPKEIRIKDYRLLEPVITLIWMVDDSLGFTKDYITQVLTLETVVNFIKNNELWKNSEIIELLKQREELLKDLNNTTKEMDFLSKNKLTYIFQKNVIKNKEKLTKYYRWFDFAEKSKNKDNVEEDFDEYKKDKIFLEIIRRIGKEGLKDEDYRYIRDYEELLVEMKRYDEDIFEQGLEKGEKIGLKKGKREMILTLQKNGLSLDEIFKLTDLSIEEIKNLLEEQ